MSISAYAVEISGLTKTYGSLKAVDSLDLCVRSGEIFGFLGPNGAGKTTTLKMLAGLTRPDSGRIVLMGTEAVFGGQAGRSHLGYLPDVPECYGYMNAGEFLSLGASLYGMTPQESRSRVAELLLLVGLEGVKKRIGSFSRGMKQRIGIAQALINNPDIVLMDEPVSALDPEGRYDVIEILRQVKGRTTVFFSTHIISDIERVCDSVAIISKGRLLEHGSVAELKEKHDNNRISISLPKGTDRSVSESFIGQVRSRSWATDVQALTDVKFQITVNSRKNAQSDIPRLLSESNIPLETMDSVSVSLEEIFLEVTKQ
ncbi:MAG: ABC transporter ATP-binding protein [Saccharofermentanales bacterium]